MTDTNEVEKSNNHIDFIGKFEYFTINGELFRAPKAYPVVSGSRSGRWEAKANQVANYMKMVKEFI